MLAIGANITGNSITMPDSPNDDSDIKIQASSDASVSGNKGTNATGSLVAQSGADINRNTLDGVKVNANATERGKISGNEFRKTTPPSEPPPSNRKILYALIGLATAAATAAGFYFKFASSQN